MIQMGEKIWVVVQEEGLESWCVKAFRTQNKAHEYASRWVEDSSTNWKQLDEDNYWVDEPQHGMRAIRVQEVKLEAEPTDTKTDVRE